jgi:hypothetical protein
VIGLRFRLIFSTCLSLSHTYGDDVGRRRLDLSPLCARALTTRMFTYADGECTRMIICRNYLHRHVTVAWSLIASKAIGQQQSQFETRSLDAVNVSLNERHEIHSHQMAASVEY